MRHMDAEEIIGEVLGRCLGLRTLSAARVIARRYDAALKPVNLTTTQFTLLVATAKMKPQSIADLGRLLSIERSGLSRNLKVMEARNLVERDNDTTTRRKKIRITRKGIETMKRAYPHWEKMQKSLEKEMMGVSGNAPIILSKLRRG